MQEFYFDIKAREIEVRKKEGNGTWLPASETSTWKWPPVWSGRIEAKDRADARKKIEEEYNQRFIMKDGIKVKDVPFLLSIKPMTNYLSKRFEAIQCMICGSEYTANDLYVTGLSDIRFCSIGCSKEHKIQSEISRINNVGASEGFNDYNTPPVIYCIKHIGTGKCYIGKSIRSFTLRWWEHIKISKNSPSTSNKFYKALRDSSIIDWDFKVVEIVCYPEGIKTRMEMDRYTLIRETEWMKHYDSVRNGYNTMESVKTEADKLQIQLELN